MLRMPVLAIAVVLALLGNIVLAQTPGEPTPTPLEATQTPPESTQTPSPAAETPLPTAGPNEIIFVGEVPAPPGTTVTIEFLDVINIRPVLCGTSLTTPVDDPALSGFSLAVDASCARGLQDPRFCWGDGLCHFFFEFPVGKQLGGTTFNLGLLSAPQPETLLPGSGDTGPTIGLPPTGTALSSETGSGALWVLLSGLVLCGTGLALAVTSRARPRR